jgi:hypothetical protein
MLLTEKQNPSIQREMVKTTNNYFSGGGEYRNGKISIQESRGCRLSKLFT